MISIFYNANPNQFDTYANAVTQGCQARGIEVTITDDPQNPEHFDYMLFAPNGPHQDLSGFRNVKLIQSLWAGVEVALKNPSLTQPLARMVEPGMSQGMADYVTGHVLAHHLDTAFFATRKPGQWHEERVPKLSSQRVVGFLGLGALGQYCACKLRDFGFEVIGWSRQQKQIEGIGCYSGDAGFREVLGKADIVVLLLPQTPATTHILNAQSLKHLKHGATIINPGRGPLIDDKALLDALDRGQVSFATLDVFAEEPLPEDHPYWTHEKVLVTPHVASATRVDTAIDTVVENIRRGETGQPFLHLVDPETGY